MTVGGAMWLFLALPGIVNVTHGFCPQGNGEAQKQLEVCLRQFPKLSDFAGGIQNPSVIRHYCATMAETDVRCAENVIHGCRKSAHVRQQLEKTLNVNVIRNTMNLVCANINTLVNSQHCIGRQQPMITSCLNTLYRTYADKLEFLKQSRKSHGDVWFNNELYKSLCEYTDDLSLCLQPFRISCGSNVGDVMHQLFEGSRPPICARQNPTQTPIPATPELELYSNDTFLELAELHVNSSDTSDDDGVKQQKHAGTVICEPTFSDIVPVVVLGLFAVQLDF